jgi:hypothetical protein
MTADLVFALEWAKFASREVYGVRRNEPAESELFKLLFKQMIFQVLGDPQCLEELTADEITSLTGTLILHS